MLGKGSLLLGRYRIVALLGEGGMAAVYRAVDERLEREVAIKVLSVEHFPPAMIEQIRRRFAREARLLARLSHPHIVPIYDYGEWEGAPFLVMAYLPGGTLKDRLKAQGKLAWREALQLLLPVTEALAVAHEHGIVHRDVKPANILFDRAGRPYIGDFGVAKIFGGGEDSGTTLTGTGMAVGTPHYMAPEQWEGEAGPQTDVYALGVVLYEMLTGTKPYDGRTPAEVYRKQLTQPLPSVGNTVPREVARLLAQALQRDPAGRFADMRAMAQAMEKVLVESGREKQALAAEVKPVVEHGAGEEKIDDFDTVVEAGVQEETAFETVVEDSFSWKSGLPEVSARAEEEKRKAVRVAEKAPRGENIMERGKRFLSQVLYNLNRYAWARPDFTPPPFWSIVLITMIVGGGSALWKYSFVRFLPPYLSSEDVYLFLILPMIVLFFPLWFVTFTIYVLTRQPWAVFLGLLLMEFGYNIVTLTEVKKGQVVEFLVVSLPLILMLWLVRKKRLSVWLLGGVALLSDVVWRFYLVGNWGVTITEGLAADFLGFLASILIAVFIGKALKKW